MTTHVALLRALQLDRRASPALYRQLADGIRDAVLNGTLGPGARLPASRALAADLMISRNTVVSAFDQLVDEGFLECRIGDGTRVARVKLDHMAAPAAADRHQGMTGVSIPTLSAAGRRLTAKPPHPRCSNPAFATGLPALDEFPQKLWARIVGKAVREFPPESGGYADAGGYLPLRETIARHLNTTRGVRCLATQVIVTAGAQAALDLSARMLLDPGDHAWIEDPGYLGARSALEASGAHLVPVPVDDEGFALSHAVASTAAGRPPRLIYVTPSYQFPLGITMSLPRRAALLEFAYDHDTWILEDDYDSDFRYRGRPLSALQGLDTAGRVLYAGTFSKTLLPSVRVGYLVVPHGLAESFSAATRNTGQETPVFVQTALHEFMDKGYYRAHLRRMHRLYERRQANFVALVRRHLNDYLEVGPRAAGLQLVAFYRDGRERVGIEQHAAEAGVNVRCLSTYCLHPPKRPGLFLGYAGVPEHRMLDGIRRLRRALERCPA